MMKIAILGAAAAGLFAAGAPPAQAQQARDYPWCAVRQNQAEYGDCSYVSFAQCKQAVVPNETCIPNALAQDRRPLRPMR
jgi:hypothetical protein